MATLIETNEQFLYLHARNNNPYWISQQHIHTPIKRTESNIFLTTETDALRNKLSKQKSWVRFELRQFIISK